MVRQMDLKFEGPGNAKDEDKGIFGKQKAIPAISFANLTFLPGGKEFLLYAGGPTVRLFDGTSGNELRAFQSQGQNLYDAALASDGKTLAVVEDSGTVRLWSTTTVKEQLAITKHTRTDLKKANKKKVVGPAGADPCVVFAPDDKVLATGSEKDGIFFWEVATGKLLLSRLLAGGTGKVPEASLRCVFLPDGKTFVYEPSQHPSVLGFRPPGRKSAPVGPTGDLSGPAPGLYGRKTVFLPEGKTLLLSGSVNPGMSGPGLALSK